MSFTPPQHPDPADNPQHVTAGEQWQVTPGSPPPVTAPPNTAGRLVRGFALHPHFGWAILWCVAMLILTQLAGGVIGAIYILAAFLLNVGGLDTAGSTAEIMAHPQVQMGIAIGLGSAHLLMILLSLLVLRVVVGRDWMRQVAVRLPSLAHVGLIVVLTPAFWILANGVFYFVHEVLHIPNLTELMGAKGAPDVSDMINGWPLALAVFLIGMLPALSEELWCRGFIGRGLVGIHGYVAGVLMTSLLFGAIHVDPCQGTMAAVVGVVLHYVYLTTRSLLAPMLLHSLNNTSSVLMARFAPAGVLDESAALPPFAYAAAGFLLCAVVFALYQSRARLVVQGEQNAWLPPYPGVACPPPGSSSVVVTPSPSFAATAMVLLALAAFVIAISVLARAG